MALFPDVPFQQIISSMESFDMELRSTPEKET